MFFKKIRLLVLILPVMLVFADASVAKLTKNPHNEMECGKCHAANVKFGQPLDKLEFVEDDIVNMCTKCHSEIIKVHHPQRVQVSGEVPDYLPLGEGNSINCRTCHDIHMKDTSMHFLRTASIGYYTSRIDICYDCHKKNFKNISPHVSREEEAGIACLICHRDAPTIKDTRETVTLVTQNIVKMCNFCHIIDTDNHPLNVDRTIEISKALPLSRNKKVVCITCHDPHGTVNTINFLRERYVIDLEFGKYENPHNIKEYFNCLKCHVDVSSAKEYVACKYKDDFILLCYNCHGTDAEKCHPVNIALLDEMELPEGFELNDDDLITCVTCHNPDCSGGKKIRYRSLDALTTSNCNDCHNYSGLKSINPHMGKDETTTCFYCHKKDHKIGDFGMSQKFICFRCHKYKKHPSGIDHLVVPRAMMDVIEQVKLDKKGKIKCSTCHDPHSKDKMHNKLRKFENISICEACHQM